MYALQSIYLGLVPECFVILVFILWSISLQLYSFKTMAGFSSEESRVESWCFFLHNNNNILQRSSSIQQYNSITPFRFLDPIPMCVCGGGMWGVAFPHTHCQAIFEHQQGVGELTSIVMLSAWRQHQTPRLRALSYNTALHPRLWTLVTSSRQLVTCAFDLQATEWRFHRPPLQV